MQSGNYPQEPKQFLAGFSDSYLFESPLCFCGESEFCCGNGQFEPSLLLFATRFLISQAELAH